MKLFLLLTAMAAYGAPKLVRLQTVPASVALHGAKSGQQFLAIATYSDGTEADVTGDANWSVSNAAVARVTPAARVSSVADGDATVEAVLDGVKARSVVKISGSSMARPFQFARDIGSILTKRGCNS